MTHWGGVFLWFEPGGERSHSVYTVDMVYTVYTGDKGDHYGKDRAAEA